MIWQRGLIMTHMKRLKDSGQGLIMLKPSMNAGRSLSGVASWRATSSNAC
jgi:hypothetical protein